MADDKDVLLEMFKHYMNQGLYHQSQRAATANILLILSGVTIGFISVDKDKELGGPDVFAALFLIVLGLFGILWSIKYHERYAYYLQRARGYRDKLDLSLPDIHMKTINDTADADIEKKYGPINWIEVWWLWTALYVLIVVFGVVILGLISPLVILALLGLVIVVAFRRPDLVKLMLSSIGRIVYFTRSAWQCIYKRWRQRLEGNDVSR